MENISKKSEILFLYETSYNVPNGDPFTGEQRCDEETKKILVSDVRMKRFVRDYLSAKDNVNIYIQQKEDGVIETGMPNEIINTTQDATSGEVSEADSDNLKNTKGTSNKKEGSGSSRRIDELREIFKKDIAEAKAISEPEAKAKPDNGKQKAKKSTFSEALYVMKKCIDVRLFGGISTKTNDAVNLTGPVQFALLNPSLNRVDLKIHQNTSVLESKLSNKQGAIATTTLVPYSLIQIHGWINPKVAEKTEMTPDDLKLMFEGLWYGTSGDGSSHSRSKVGQNSVLLLEIVYKENNQKIYGVDRLIQLIPAAEKRSESLRSLGIDGTENTTESTSNVTTQAGVLDFSRLITISKEEKVEMIRFYTEIEKIKTILGDKPKFEEIKFLTT